MESVIGNGSGWSERPRREGRPGQGRALGSCTLANAPACSFCCSITAHTDDGRCGSIGICRTRKPLAKSCRLWVLPTPADKNRDAVIPPDRKGQRSEKRQLCALQQRAQSEVTVAAVRAPRAHAGAELLRDCAGAAVGQSKAFPWKDTSQPRASTGQNSDKAPAAYYK